MKRLRKETHKLEASLGNKGDKLRLSQKARKRKRKEKEGEISRLIKKKAQSRSAKSSQ